MNKLNLVKGVGALVAATVTATLGAFMVKTTAESVAHDSKILANDDNRLHLPVYGGSFAMGCAIGLSAMETGALIRFGVKCLKQVRH